MKKMLLTLTALLLSVTMSAMPYEEARDRARFLTDKMAYELNLNDAQYNDAYEINLDYFMSINTAGDVYGSYLSYRNADLRHILLDWQYSLFAAADYFFHPICWRSGAWYLPVYNRYSINVFYYDRPRVYFEDRGGHGRHYHHAGFYVHRRPAWQGGFRGESRRPVVHRGHEGRRPATGGARPGYRFEPVNRPGQGPGRPNHEATRPGNQPQRPNTSERPGRPETSRPTQRPQQHNGTVGGRSRPGRSNGFQAGGAQRPSRNTGSTYQRRSSTRTTVHQTPSRPANRPSAPAQRGSHRERGGRR